MKLYSFLLTGALVFGLSTAAMAEAPEGMIVAQAKTKLKDRAAKKKATKKVAKKVAKKAAAKKKVAKKAEPAELKEMAGQVEVERGKKGALKTVHIVTADGERMPVMINAEARKMAKLGGAMTVKGKVITRKGVSWFKLVSFEQTPADGGDVAAPADPVAAPASDAPVDAPADDAPAGDAPAGDAPVGDAPADDAPADDAPADDAPSDDN